MVYSRSQYCAILIPPRFRNRRYSDVSLQRFDSISYLDSNPIPSLSWADTAACTFGRLYGSHTRKIPARIPLLRLPLAPRKSLAGFTAATTITGDAAALGFWGFVAPIRNGGLDLSWAWQGGVRQCGCGWVVGFAGHFGRGGSRERCRWGISPSIGVNIRDVDYS